MGPFSPKAEKALAYFKTAREAGRMPHAVLVAGDPRGEGKAFAEELMRPLFPAAAAGLDRHPDIRWIEPESKSRVIKVEEHMRPFNEFVSLTSYEGGWKAGVVLFAERMNEASQNALLKTLEEPPERTLIVLVTQQPSELLATVRSRTFFVDLGEEGRTDAPWKDEVLALLAEPPARRPLEIAAWAARLGGPLEAIKGQAAEDEAEEAEAKDPGAPEPDKEAREARVASRVKEAQEGLFRYIQLFQRDLLEAKTGGECTVADRKTAEALAARYTLDALLKRVEAVEKARKAISRNIKAETVLFLLARDLSLPQAVR
jgi:DNA polymerase-3 subunit delta'